MRTNISLHLALASQSLSVVSELIPYVRETFRRHLNQAEAVLLVDFDKLKRVSRLFAPILLDSSFRFVLFWMSAVSMAQFVWESASHGRPRCAPFQHRGIELLPIFLWLAQFRVYVVQACLTFSSLHGLHSRELVVVHPMTSQDQVSGHAPQLGRYQSFGSSRFILLLSMT